MPARARGLRPALRAGFRKPQQKRNLHRRRIADARRGCGTISIPGLYSKLEGQSMAMEASDRRAFAT